MNINLQLFGISYYTCDICGENFADCSDYACCDKCGRVFCCDDCAEDGILTYIYYDNDGNECSEDDDYDYQEVSSCKFCRKEDFDDEQILKYLLDKYKLTKDDVKSEMKNKEQL